MVIRKKIVPLPSDLCTIMNKMNKFITLIALLIAIFSTSCTSTKKLIYLQGIDSTFVKQQALVAQDYALKIQSDDFISVKVGTKEGALLEPFVNNVILGMVGTSSQTSTGTSQKTMYYQVDSRGYVSLPLLGDVFVRGTTCTELEKQLAAKLVEQGYIYDPSVSCKIMNFKISILGEVKNPGTISVDGDRITILEAIAKSGDLQGSGLRENVLVVREENGVRSTNRINLTSPELLSSPYYYLRQNDVVYVEPNKSIIVKSSPFFTFWSSSSSILSVIISIVSLVTAISK